MTPAFPLPRAKPLRRRPLALAIAASLALHGAALAGAHFLMQGDPPGPPRTHTVAIEMVEPAAPTNQQAAPRAVTAPAKPVIIDPPVARRTAAPVPAVTTAPPAARPRSVSPTEPPAEPKPVTPDPARAVTDAPDALAALTPPRRPERTVQQTAPAHAAPPPQQARLADGPATPPAYGRPGLANPAPRYPWLARQRGEQGRVVLRVAVDAGGRATQVQVASSSGSGRLDRAAMAAIRHWRFAPARRAGQAVPGAVEVPVTFRLSDP